MTNSRFSGARRLALLTMIIVACAAPASWATNLSAELNLRPNMGLYKPGEDVVIRFHTAEAQAGWTLRISVKDEHGKELDAASMDVSEADWTGSYAAPDSKLGFYRVYASLYDGDREVRKLTAVNTSRPDGFLTYAIVPDPAKRPAAIDEKQAFFGLQGGFLPEVGTDIFAFLGVRWNTDGGWKWKTLSPSVEKKFDGSDAPPPMEAWATNGAGGPWTIYNMPNLTKDGGPYRGDPDVFKPGTFAYNTGALKPEFESDWVEFCKAVARSWPRVYGERTQPVYEVTWEPIQKWGYKGSDEELVRLYELAYPAIKSVDAKAQVAGPCMHVNSPKNIEENEQLLKLGLGKHIDVFSSHPYMDSDIVTGKNPFRAPELNGQPALIRTMKRKLRQHMGRDVVMIGTEQGYRTRQNIDREIDQARRLVRSQLMTLGEGWRMSIAFYIADYHSRDNVDHKEYWDWGLFYNMNTKLFGGYGPDRISPKPVAAAYAAMTYLMENRHSVGYINWLDDSVRGYALARFGDAEDVTLALWDFERDPDNAREVTIGVGAAKVDVYDWMGNKTEQATESGKLTVVLSKEPIYIAGVDAKRWSGARSDRNIARGKAVTASSTAGGRYAAELAVDGDSVSHESRWCSEDDQKAAKWITVDLGAEHSIDEVRFWTGQYQPGWGANTYQQPLEKFSLQRWSEGKWVNLASRSGNKQAVVVERFDAVVASKVRLYVPAWSTSQIKLYELEIMQANAE